MVVSPFVYGLFRGNYGIGANTSAETGLGASLRGFFDEDKYHAPRDAVELLPRLGYTVHDSLATPSVVFSITVVARFCVKTRKLVSRIRWSGAILIFAAVSL